MNIKWLGSPNYNPGRSQPISKIIIHRMAGTLASTDTVFANPSSKVSAHYGIENNTVHQYVQEKDTAWHAISANPFSIGIENSAAPGRPASDETYNTLINLCRDICNRYGLNPDTDIEPHNKYVATQCPGTMDLERIKQGVKGEDIVKPNDAQVVSIFNTFLNKSPKDQNEINYYTAKDIRDLYTNVLNATMPTADEVKQAFANQGLTPSAVQVGYYTKKNALAMYRDLNAVAQTQGTVAEQKKKIDELIEQGGAGGYTDADRAIATDTNSKINQLTEWFKKTFNIGGK